MELRHQSDQALNGQPPVEGGTLREDVDRRAVFPLFDSLRAIAALSIFVYHAKASRGPSLDPDVAPYVARLSSGVLLFFVISGFLLYRPFVDARVNGRPRPGTRGYAWRRFLRIVPAYWVALTLIALALGLSYVFSADGALYYGFAQNVRGDTVLHGIGPAWTLGVEVLFYAFLPLWAALMWKLRGRNREQRLGREALAVTGLMAASFLFNAQTIYSMDSIKSETLSALTRSLPRYLEYFGLGMLLAIASVWLAGRALPRGLRVLDRFPGVAWAVAAVAFWASATQINGGARIFESLSPHEKLARDALLALTMVALALPAVVGDQRRGTLRRVLANRALLWVGLVSYGLYLWHSAVLAQLYDWNVIPTVADWLGVAYFWAAVVIALGPVLGLAALSYYVVERPALSLKRLPAGAAATRLASAAQPLAFTAAAGLIGVALLAGVSGIGLLLCIAGGVLAVWLAAQPARRRIGNVRPGRALFLLGAVVSATALLALFIGPPGLGKPGKTRSGQRPLHLVATYDGAQMRLYGDGRLMHAQKLAARPDAVKKDLEIASSGGKRAWSGVLDEVALYGAPLPARTIARHAELGRGGGSGEYARAIEAEPSLASWWRLGAADDRRAVDSRGNADGAYDGTPHAPTPGLVKGSDDGAARFDGLGGGVKRIPVAELPALGSGYTIEAWGTAASFSDRPIVGSPGGVWLRLDVLGRLQGGFYSDGKAYSATTSKGLSGTAVRGRVKRSPEPALLVLFAGLALLAAGALRSIGVPQRPSRKPPARAQRPRPPAPRGPRPRPPARAR